MPSETLSSNQEGKAIAARVLAFESALMNQFGSVWPSFWCGGSLLAAMASDFNIGPSAASRSEGAIQYKNPTLKMTSTKIELSFYKINRVTDLSDLAEMLFPGNRNQQHAFLVVWLALKWAESGIVSNLLDATSEHGVSKRTLERVRARMRRLGLVDHVSRFDARHDYREGWRLSGRFSRSLALLAARVNSLAARNLEQRDKEELLVQLAEARRHAVAMRRVGPTRAAW